MAVSGMPEYVDTNFNLGGTLQGLAGLAAMLGQMQQTKLASDRQFSQETMQIEADRNKTALESMRLSMEAAERRTQGQLALIAAQAQIKKDELAAQSAMIQLKVSTATADLQLARTQATVDVMNNPNYSRAVAAYRGQRWGEALASMSALQKEVPNFGMADSTVVQPLLDGQSALSTTLTIKDIDGQQVSVGTLLTTLRTASDTREAGWGTGMLGKKLGLSLDAMIAAGMLPESVKRAPEFWVGYNTVERLGEKKAGEYAAANTTLQTAKTALAAEQARLGVSDLSTVEGRSALAKSPNLSKLAAGVTAAERYVKSFEIAGMSPTLAGSVDAAWKDILRPRVAVAVANLDAYKGDLPGFTRDALHPPGKTPAEIEAKKDALMAGASARMGANGERIPTQLYNRRLLVGNEKDPASLVAPADGTLPARIMQSLRVIADPATSPHIVVAAGEALNKGIADLNRIGVNVTLNDLAPEPVRERITRMASEADTSSYRALQLLREMEATAPLPTFMQRMDRANTDRLFRASIDQGDVEGAANAIVDAAAHIKRQARTPSTWYVAPETVKMAETNPLVREALLLAQSLRGKQGVAASAPVAPAPVASGVPPPLNSTPALTPTPAAKSN